MRRLALALLAFAGAAIVPAVSVAVVPGVNGPIIFTSGRDAGSTVLSDNVAQIWILSGGGAQRVTLQDALHHRHSSWSPDRTKIAYARGASGAFTGPWDIYVQDLTQPISGTNPVQITNTPALGEDRPTWSPDGTRLAYAKQVIAGEFWDVVTKSANGVGGETTVAADASVGAGASGQFSRPQWGPDGSVIYYGRAIAVGTYDIYRSPSNGTNVIGTAVVTGTGNDYQPALSPDGSKLCFTRDEGGGEKDVVVQPLGAGTTIPDLGANGGADYECAWSPDGQRIAFTRGGFSMGQLMARNSDGTGTTATLTDVDGRFDGNAEWTYNPRPVCQNVSVQVAVNGFARIPLTCTDAPNPPSFQPTSPFDPDIVAPPQNGVLGGLDDDDTVIYTPNLNFRGTDSFSFLASDGTSDSEVATVAINVAQGGGGGGGGAGEDPEISGLGVSPKRFKRGRALPSLLSAATGTTIRFSLSEDARTKLAFARARPGRRVGGKCRKPTRRNRGKRKCTRYVSAGSFSVDAKNGSNRVRFQGRISRRKRLPLGKYRLTARATDGDGNRSNAPRASFRIVRR